MIMKKLLPLFCLLFAAMQVQAQAPVGSVSLIPRLGYTCSRLAGLPAIEDFDKGCLWGAAAGLDVEFQASRVVAVSLGAAYSRQGASFVPCSDISYYTSSSVKYEERVGYVNFPVMASAYLFKGFALKAGLQAGVRLGESEMAKKVELGIPVGASYEHKGLVMEVRYAIGTGMVPTEGGSADRGRNMVLSFMVGYRIPLGHYKKASSAAG